MAQRQTLKHAKVNYTAESMGTKPCQDEIQEIKEKEKKKLFQAKNKTG